jgi:D-alanyl-D-alanine carboxypeptidase (penicillin-binding protein 5/6)
VRRALVLAGVLTLLAPPGARAAAPAAGPAVSDAKAFVVVDARDGTVLGGKAPNRKLAIASTTKLMTAYLALQRLKPKQKLAAPAYKVTDAESLIGLRKGEKLSVRDLIYGLVLESANDAAETLAVGVSGSIGAFVGEMNATAQSLGLTHTHYSTPVGLDEPGNYSSARDLVTLAGVLLKNPLFAKAADSATATLKTGDHPRSINTRNLLIPQVPFVTGVKTGHTLDAGYVLVGSGEKNGTTLISAVLGTPSEGARDADTLALLRYGFSQYTPSTAVKAGQELATPKVKYKGDHLSLVAAKPLQVSARQGEKVATHVDAPGEVNGAVKKGEQLGTVSVTVAGRPAGSVPLVAAEAVSAASFAQKAVATARSPIVFIPLGLIVILLGMLLAGRGSGGGDSGAPSVNRSKPKPSDRARSAEERERMRKERMRRRESQPK